MFKGLNFKAKCVAFETRIEEIKTHHWRANASNNQSNARAWNPFEKHVTRSILNWNAVILNPDIHVVDINILSCYIDSIRVECSQINKCVCLELGYSRFNFDVANNKTIGISREKGPSWTVFKKQFFESDISTVFYMQESRTVCCMYQIVYCPPP